MAIVTFRPENQQPPRTGAQALDGLLLVPGVNTLSQADLAKAQTHPAWGALLALGAVEVAGGAAAPEIAEPPADTPADTQANATHVSHLRLNLNTATQADLEALPRVGPATASKLRAARPFASLAGAHRASGLSASAWAEVAPLVFVEEI